MADEKTPNNSQEQNNQPDDSKSSESKQTSSAQNKSSDSSKSSSGKTSAGKTSATAKGGKKSKKDDKPPPVEDKPFAEFMHQDYLPALKEKLQELGLEDLEVKFDKQTVPQFGPKAECWQTIGQWNQGKRQFNVYFPKGDIKGLKGFSMSNDGAQTSTIEPFLVDERKISLELLVLGVVQRLNAQKWLDRN
jgi:hypothetical protein